MTDRDTIIRMAREAGMERVVEVHSDGTRTVELPHPDLLANFTHLIKQHLISQGYRKCAQVEDRLARHGIPMPCQNCRGIGYDASGQLCGCQP